MLFQEFRKAFYETGCFSSAQVHAWYPGFDKNNLRRWINKRLLVKLRQGFYCFPEYLGQAGYELVVANRIYRPSYISLHSALAYYGLIPEGIVQTTSVTTKKTASFTNPFGTFTYQTVKPELLFGYEMKTLYRDRSVLIAAVEKGLVDLLYLYPFYNSAQELKALRLDEEVVREMVDRGKIQEFTARFSNKELEKRVDLLVKIYLP